MDEMTLLEEFRAAVAPPDEMALARARARVINDGAPGPHHPGRLRLLLQGTRGRFALAGLTGVAVTATAAAVAMAVAAPDSGTPPSAMPVLS